MYPKTPKEILLEKEIFDLKNSIEQIKNKEIIRKVTNFHDTQNTLTKNYLKSIELSNNILQCQIESYLARLESSMFLEFKLLCDNNNIIYSRYVPYVATMVNFIKYNHPNNMYHHNILRVDNYILYKPQEEQIVKIKHSDECRDKSDLTKLVHDILKQIISKYIDKSTLNEQDKKFLEVCQDILDTFDIGQTLRTPEKPLLSKLQAIIKLVEILNKHCPITQY